MNIGAQPPITPIMTNSNHAISNNPAKIANNPANFARYPNSTMLTRSRSVLLHESQKSPPCITVGLRPQLEVFESSNPLEFKVIFLGEPLPLLTWKKRRYRYRQYQYQVQDQLLDTVLRPRERRGRGSVFLHGGEPRGQGGDAVPVDRHGQDVEHQDPSKRIRPPWGTLIPDQSLSPENH